MIYESHQGLPASGQTTLTLRNLCERYSTGAGGYGRRQPLPRREVTGRVDMLGHSWLHIKLNMLLPHCRYQTPVWLSDTIRLLLDGYEASGGQMPYYRDRAVLVIDEHSDVDGRSMLPRTNWQYSQSRSSPFPSVRYSF